MSALMAQDMRSSIFIFDIFFSFYFRFYFFLFCQVRVAAAALMYGCISKVVFSVISELNGYVYS